jgi:hypothetical protein
LSSLQPMNTWHHTVKYPLVNLRWWECHFRAILTPRRTRRVRLGFTLLTSAPTSQYWSYCQVSSCKPAVVGMPFSCNSDTTTNTAGPIRFHSFDVSARVTVLMSSRSTYCHAVLQ